MSPAATQVIDNAIAAGISVTSLEILLQVPIGSGLAAVVAKAQTLPPAQLAHTQRQLANMVVADRKDAERLAAKRARRDAEQAAMEQAERVANKLAGMHPDERPTEKQVDYATYLGADREMLAGMTRREVSALIDRIKGKDASSAAWRAGARLGIHGQIWDDED